MVAFVVITGVYLLAFPYRTDYPAHVALGAATVVVVSGLVGLMGPTGPAVGVACVPMVAVGGLLAERTLTGPEVDGIDLATGVLGAAVAAAALLEPRHSRGDSAALVALGCLFMLVAYGLRYGASSVG